LPHDAMQVQLMPSCGVRLSVTFLHYVKTSNCISQNVTVGQPNHSSFSIPNVMVIFRRGPPNGGIECRWGRQKSQFCTNSWLSINDCCCVDNNCDDGRCSLLQRASRISESLSQPACTTTTKRTEENLIVRRCKS